ncbi:MAG TPA: glutaredoxin domain-containing protein [Polyangiaceae bacterium]
MGCLSLALTLGVFASCTKRRGDAAPAGSVSASDKQLPKLELRDDTSHLLLTWVDDKGDFHVVQKVPDVPAASRSKVRVVLTDREAGTGDLVYVADLNGKRPDGTYATKTVPRTTWDEIGASRRKARLEALAPSASSSVPGVAPSAPETAAKKGAVVAIVYGAAWCRACHDAARYLRQHGVQVVEKDIEQSDAARDEMRQKLARARLPGASIPVIDLMGEVQIGFSPSALDHAVNSARDVQSL